MNQEKIWDHFQNEQRSSFDGALPRYRYLAKKAKSGNVLNIGVGAGGLERELSKRIDLTVYALDPNKQSIEKLRSDLDMGERAAAGYSQQIPFEDSLFDTVIMSEVLEHLDDETLKKTVAEVKRVLKNGGTFIGTVPANEQLEANNVVCPKCGELFHRWGHQQSFSIERLSKILLTPPPPQPKYHNADKIHRFCRLDKKRSNRYRKKYHQIYSWILWCFNSNPIDIFQDPK